MGNFLKLARRFLQFRHGIFRNQWWQRTEAFWLCKKHRVFIELIWEKSLSWTILGWKGHKRQRLHIFTMHFKQHYYFLIWRFDCKLTCVCLLYVKCRYYKTIHNIKSGATGLQQATASWHSGCCQKLLRRRGCIIRPPWSILRSTFFATFFVAS